MTTDTAAAPAATLEHLDPASLLADKNIRDEDIDDGLLASVKEHGVLVPLVAIRTDIGEIRIRYGHRRRAAAIQAGQPTVPVMVVAGVDDGTGEAGRILAQFDENTHRKDLTVVETAGVVQQLLDLGLDVQQVQRKTRLDKKQVAAAQAIVGSPAAVAASAKVVTLTLDQAAGIAEFDGDNDAVAQLTRAAAESPGQFAHQLQRLRDQRDDQAEQAALAAKLEKRGIKVTHFPGWDHPPKLENLLDDAGQPLTEKTHRKCPGHAAYLNRRGWGGGAKYEAVYFCTDPKANGHKRIRGAGAGAMSDNEKTERKQVLAGNKAWRSAEKVRRTWLREFLGRQTPPDDALPWIISELVRGDFTLVKQMENGWKGAQDLLGFKVDTSVNYGKTSVDGLCDMLAKARPGRQQVILLALILGAYENWTDVHIWRRAEERYREQDSWSCRYFTALKAWGYEPSEIEQLVIDGPAKARAKQAAMLAGQAAASAAETDPEPGDDGDGE